MWHKAASELARKYLLVDGSDFVLQQIVDIADIASHSAEPLDDPFEDSLQIGVVDGDRENGLQVKWTAKLNVSFRHSFLCSFNYYFK